MEMTSITLRKDLVENGEPYLPKTGLNWETFFKIFIANTLIKFFK